jgi:hypothetical protein
MLNQHQLNDAQAALGFLIAQTSHIESQVWAKKYPDLTYAEDIPVDTSAHPWAKSVTYYATDKTGKAAWLHGRGQDFPLVQTNRTKFETAVEMAGIGYDYTLEEINQARMLGINLSADEASAARRAYEELVDGVAYVGDADKGFTGLTNYSGISPSDVADGAGAADTTWETKTADEILKDINEALTGTWTASKTIELADTLLLPLSSYAFISTKRLDSTMSMTVLEYLEKSNVYTMQTKKPLRIRARRELETAGTSGHKRFITYKRDPEVLKLHLPMPLQFLAPQQVLMTFIVPGMFRLGGLDIRRPGAFRYRDYI